MDRVAGPLLAIAFIAVAGMGLYAYSLRGQLADAKIELAAVEQNRDGFKAKLDQVGGKLASSSVAVDTCNTQLKDAQAKLDASTKKTAARR